jgi:DNA polymerase-1
LAQLSQDSNLKQAFLDGHDIHAQTAARLFDIALNQVSNDPRQIGKRINFSILYGLTPYGLSKDLGISMADAKQYIEKYFAQYPQVSDWMASVVDETKKRGYVTTYWGRRRYIPGIYENNKTLYELAKRIAVNTKAQGTAAEIMKFGMINLVQELKSKKLDAVILLQIHDELLISVAKQQKEMVEKVVKQVLEAVVDWDIPLKVMTRFGKNWKEVTK